MICATYLVLVSAIAYTLATPAPPPLWPGEHAAAILQTANDTVKKEVASASLMFYLSRQTGAVRTDVGTPGFLFTTWEHYTQNVQASIFYSLHVCSNETIPEGDELPPVNALENATFVGESFDPVSMRAVNGWALTKGESTHTYYFTVDTSELVRIGSVDASGTGETIVASNPTNTQPAWWFDPDSCPYNSMDAASGAKARATAAEQLEKRMAGLLPLVRKALRLPALRTKA
eukprot:TRINITY_DN2641_c0_g1_i1.p1 TRINITY_DN2641_c0_g1~~TRINITY_DN2641_c0_g1_i1.p1  ORF type:complete len:243 (+),score=39.25 TRINITY_DN2641_c0_g1_i1:34-729(+)